MAKEKSTSVFRHPASVAAYFMCLFFGALAHFSLGDLAWPLHLAAILACLTIISGLWFSKRQLGLTTKRALLTSHVGGKPITNSENRPCFIGANKKNDSGKSKKPEPQWPFIRSDKNKQTEVYKSLVTDDYSPLLASAKSARNAAVIDLGLPAGVMRRLNELLRQMNLPHMDTLKTARDWMHRYRLLRACLTQLAETEEEYSLAVELLQRGQFAEVLRKVDALLENSLKHPNLHAADYYNRALLLELEFKPAPAVNAYAKAYRHNPDNPAYGFGYARNLLELNQTKSVETHFRKALQNFRKLPNDAISPSLSHLAAYSLNILGLQYADGQKTEEAHAAFVESLIIYRLLCSRDPEVYNPDLALCLRDLACFHQKSNHLDDAGIAFMESLEIHRAMAWTNPSVYLPELAKFLDRLGAFYRWAKLPDFAEIALRESLEIHDRLARKNPAAYLPRTAISLHNLGNLYRAGKRPDEAEAAYRESLEIRRVLARENPSGYLPDLLSSLNNLGVLYRESQRFNETEEAYLESLEIRRVLVRQNPSVYLPDLSLILNNLGVLYRGARRLGEAEKAYAESLEISRALAQNNPGAYLPYVAMTLNNLGLLYRETQRPDEAESAYRESQAIRANLGVEKLEKQAA